MVMNASAFLLWIILLSEFNISISHLEIFKIHKVITLESENLGCHPNVI